MSKFYLQPLPVAFLFSLEGPPAESRRLRLKMFRIRSCCRRERLL